MLNVFPQSVGDADLGLKTYLAFLDQYPEELVVQACKRFLTGKVPGQNKAFAPSLPQFIEELDAMQERERLGARRAELEERLAADLARLKGDDGVPFHQSRNVIERLPKTWKQKFLEQKASNDAQSNG